MNPTRREWLASVAALPGAVVAADPPVPAKLGVVLYSYAIRSRVERDKGFADPAAFAAYCKDRGAAGVQLPLGRLTPEKAKALRERVETLGMFLEGSILPPKDRGDVERFDAEVKAAKDAGVDVLRTVMLGGRRYETFKTAEAYREFKRHAAESLILAEPVVARHKVRLAVENHKDYRADELAEQLRKLRSEFVGATVDTGNNLALLEDAAETVKTLAPWATTCHLKDMAVEESADGFLLSEVPLGQGFLDLKAIVKVLRAANPAIRFNLEMITRDPLRVPCLTDGYWATLADVRGRDLARTLALVRRTGKKAPLPRVASLPQDEQLAVEDRNVRESFRYAREHLGL
jgi:sugar phosphate isomerase/epimerase